jgi:MarR-like DNA-binding transcriptional regulator SgrR of sgrS sRNA
VSGERNGKTRDKYRVVGQATRQALDRANAEKLSAGEHRVVHAVIALVSSYSRLTDYFYVYKVAESAHLSERHTRDCLKRLAGLQIIVWEPRRGHKVKSLLGLPAAAEKAEVDDDKAELEEEAEEKKAELWDQESGTVAMEKRKPWSSDTREVVREVHEERTLSRLTPRRDNKPELPPLHPLDDCMKCRQRSALTEITTRYGSRLYCVSCIAKEKAA